MYGKVEHNCSIFLIISIYLIGDYMELELVKKALIEVKNVLKIIDVNTEIKDYFINDKVINGNLNVNINYFDFNDEKNTLYRNIPFEIMLDEMKVTDVLFKEANAYIVEGIGLELEYKLIAKCETFFDKEIDIIKLDDLTNENNNLVDFKPEIDKSNDESKEKIKNKIENDYEKKLSESLVERDSTAVKNDNLVNETNHLEKRTDNFDNKLKGFARADAIIAGVESRTSSPIRIERDSNLCSNILGIYPIGEGAGYAGGITTSAIDGIKVAETFANKYRHD